MDGYLTQSLENAITKRKTDKNPFKENEVVEFIQTIAESIILGSQHCNEYFDINPVNIFVQSEG